MTATDERLNLAELAVKPGSGTTIKRHSPAERLAMVVERYASSGEPVEADAHAPLWSEIGIGPDELRERVRTLRVERRRAAIASLDRLPEINRQIAEVEAEHRPVLDRLDAMRHARIPCTEFDIRQVDGQEVELRQRRDRLRVKASAILTSAREVLDRTADRSIAELCSFLHDMITSLGAQRFGSTEFNPSSGRWEGVRNVPWSDRCRAERQRLVVSLRKELETLERLRDDPEMVHV